MAITTMCAHTMGGIQRRAQTIPTLQEALKLHEDGGKFEEEFEEKVERGQ